MRNWTMMCLLAIFAVAACSDNSRLVAQNKNMHDKLTACETALKAATAPATTNPNTPVTKACDTTPPTEMPDDVKNGQNEHNAQYEVSRTTFERTRAIVVPETAPTVPAIPLYLQKSEEMPRQSSDCGWQWNMKTAILQEANIPGWAYLVEFVNGFNNGDSDNYSAEVALITLASWSSVLVDLWGKPGDNNNNETRDAVVSLRARLVEIAEDEEQLKVTMDAALPIVDSAFGRIVRGRLMSWLPDFWKASGVDMVKFEERFNNTQPDAGGLSGYLGGYNQKKLEGWFMRRWINTGRGQTGRDTVVLYRYYMARLAKTFGMPQARDWARTVRAEFSKTTTLKHKAEYVKAL
jgi:hypothetical protein